MKAKLLSLIRTAQTMSKPLPGLTKVGCECAYDVYLVLKAHFNSGEWSTKQEARKGLGKLDAIHFHCSVKDVKSPAARLELEDKKKEPMNPIQRVRGEKFKTLDGISGYYQFNVVRASEFFVRDRPCWCTPCLKDVSERQKNGNANNYTVTGCTSSPHAPEMFRYFRRYAKKIRGSGISDALPNLPETDMNQAAAEVVNGQWLLFASQDPTDKVWLARAVSNPESPNSQPIYRNDTSKTIQEHGEGRIKLLPGEVAVHVQWYERLASTRPVQKDAKYVQYVISDSFPPVSQSSFFLVCSGMKERICQMEGPLANKAYSRRLAVGKTSGRILYGGKEPKSYTKSEATARAEAKKQTWEVTAATYFEAAEMADKLVQSLEEKR